MSTMSSEVVVFCPLPPKPNGIADYFAEQLPYFCRKVRVTVVIEDTHPEPTRIDRRVTVLRLEEYIWAKQDYANVPHIYHVGNNPDTKYMLPVLLSKPGLVVVHDLNLHYLIDLTNLSQGDKHGYELALTNNYGSAGTIIGKQLTKFGWKGQFMPHELMMNSSIICAADRILVHSQYSADKIASLGHKNVCIVPHHFSPAARQYQPKLKMQYRGELGLPGNKPVITSMGFIAKAKQIKSVLKALSALKRKGLEFTYVLAGQCKAHEYDVYQDIADSGLADNVIVTGFLDEDAFFKYMLASDFIVNLRYPTGGESSGTLTRAMGMGLCCVVVNIGPFGELPSNCAVKLDWDDSFDENLCLELERLIEDKHYRVSFGKNAQKWVEKTHNISSTTEAYLFEAQQVCNSEITNTSLNNQLAKYPTANAIRDWSRRNSDSKANNLWWRANLTPMDQSSVLSVTDNQDYQTFVLRSLLGYEDTRIHCALFDDFFTSSIRNLYPLAIVDIPLAFISEAPVSAFAVLNRHIRVGGKLILSLEIQAGLSEEYDLSRPSLIQMLEAAGFVVDKTIAGPQDIDMYSKEQASVERWVFSAKKHSWMVNTNPAVYNNGASELEWYYDSDTAARG